MPINDLITKYDEKKLWRAKFMHLKCAEVDLIKGHLKDVEECPLRFRKTMKWREMFLRHKWCCLFLMIMLFGMLLVFFMGTLMGIRWCAKNYCLNDRNLCVFMPYCLYMTKNESIYIY